MLHQIKAPQFYTEYAATNKGTTILYWFRPPKTVLNLPVNGKSQVLFKASECFSSTFQSKFNFQQLFKTVLYIQVLFKPVWTQKKDSKSPKPTPNTWRGSHADFYEMEGDKFNNALVKIQQLLLPTMINIHRLVCQKWTPEFRNNPENFHA